MKIGYSSSSFRDRSHADSYRWRGDLIRLFLEHDVPQLGIAVPSAVLERHPKIS